MKEKKLKNLSDLGVNIYPDHKLPFTRREFLSSGIIGLSTMVILPSLMFKSPDALASNHPLNQRLAFLCFEGAGGMNIAGGNVMVGMTSAEQQEDYGTVVATDYIGLGLPASMHPSKSGMINKDYGLVFHSTSGLLAGMNEVLTDPITRDAIDGIIICGRTSDDTADNPINAAFQAQKAGGTGTLVQLIGGTVSPTGARSPVVSTQLRAAALSSRITTFSEGSGLLSLGSDVMNPSFLNASTVSTAGTNRIRSFLNSITNLSKVRLDSYVNNQLDAQLINNSQKGSKDVFNTFSPASLDPRNNPAALAQLQGAFGGTGIVVLNENVAAVANLVLDGTAGVGSITVGGCDYHNGSASSGQAKDIEIGRHIGKCIKLAAAKGKNLFIHLYTDGGVGGDNGGTTDDTVAGAGRVNWVTDNGAISAQICIVYKHNHKRSTSGSLLLNDGSKDRNRQIGSFLKGGGINLTSTSVSNSVDQMWKAVILNYMACTSTVTSGNPAEVVADVKARFRELFPAENIPVDADQLIRFKPIMG